MTCEKFASAGLTPLSLAAPWRRWAIGLNFCQHMYDIECIRLRKWRMLSRWIAGEPVERVSAVSQCDDLLWGSPMKELSIQAESLLQCVWYNTHANAGRACSNSQTVRRTVHYSVSAQGIVWQSPNHVNEMGVFELDFFASGCNHVIPIKASVFGVLGVTCGFANSVNVNGVTGP